MNDNNSYKYLYLIVGRSGTGKSSLVSHFCSLHNTTELKSYTTRKRRTPTEDTHIFIDNEEYVKRFSGLEASQVAAFCEFDGNFYFSTKKQLNNNLFYVIDVSGIKTLQTLSLKNFKKGICIIEIKAPFFTRLKRMIYRDGLIKGIKRMISEGKNFSGLEKIPRITLNSVDDFNQNFDNFENIIFENEIGNYENNCLRKAQIDYGK